MRWKIKAKKSEKGQSFMELAISIIFLLTLLAATIDLGWAFYTLTALRDAAQEAAVYASKCANPNTDWITNTKHWLQQSAEAPLRMSDIPDDNIQVCVFDQQSASPDAKCEAAPVLLPDIKYSVRVEVQVDHEIRTPFVANFIGSTTYPLRAEVSDRILRDKDFTGCPVSVP